VAAYTQGLGPQTLAVLQYTGGTTGVSKGAMLTHGNLLANVEQALAMGRSHIDTGKEVVLTALPLYHIFAFTFNLLCFYTLGARNMLAPSPRPIQNLQRAFDNYPVSWISGVNTLFNALLNEEWFTAFPPKHLKAAVAGGAALQHAVAERWEKVTGTPLPRATASPKVLPWSRFNPLSASASRTRSAFRCRARRCGWSTKSVAACPPVSPGELIVKGPQVMAGYWNRPRRPPGRSGTAGSTPATWR
jgi:long-chain acyl-CoA synthetase